MMKKLILSILLASALSFSFGVHRAATADIRLERKQLDGGRAIVVSTEDYTATLRPDAGGSLASLRYDGAELVYWSSERPAGLFQEASTAGKEFEVERCEHTREEVRVRLEASTDGLRVTKTFLFPAEGSSFRVHIAAENRSPYALTGPAAPRFYAFMTPAGEESSGVERVCLDAGFGARVMGPGVFTRRYSSPGAPDGTIRWVGAADVASRRGLAIRFRDAGASSPRAVLCGDETGISWSMPSVPAGSILRSEARVRIWDGMGAVTAVTDHLLARATVKQKDTPAVELKLKALNAPLEAVTVVNRLYGPDGRDLGTGQSMAFHTVTDEKVASAVSELPGAKGRVGWLLQTMRSKGNVVGRHVVPLGTPGGICPLNKNGLPAPNTTATGDHPDAGSDDTPWTIRVAGTRKNPARLRLHLANNEAETLFLAVEASEDIDHLEARLAPPSGKEKALPASAGTLWRVEDGPEPSMTRLEPAALDAGASLRLALHVSAAGISPGTLERRLVLEGGGRKVSVPLRMTVRSAEIPASGGFGLWLAPRNGSELSGEKTTFDRLAAQKVSMMTWPAGADFDVERARSLLERAAEAGLHGFGFHQSLSAENGPSSLKTAAEGDMLFPATSPLWLLQRIPCWRHSAREPAEFGFVPAGVTDRLPPGGGRDTSVLRHVLLGGGIGPEGASQKRVNGDISGESRLWLFHRLADGDPAWAAAELRNAAWAAAWQGMAGMAVDCLPGGDKRRSALLEVARDAREEAALWRQCRALAAQLRNAKLEDEEDQKRRAIVLHDRRTVLGDDADARLRISTDDSGLKPVLRVVTAEEGATPTPADFRAAKRDLLDLLERIQRLLPEQTDHLYWRGRGIVTGGEVRAQIVSDGSESAEEAASDIQSAVKKRTGRTLTIDPTFPSESQLSGGNIELVVVLGNPDDIDSLPAELAGRARASNIPITAQLSGAEIVIAPGESRWARMLVRGLTTRQYLYPTVSEMR